MKNSLRWDNLTRPELYRLAQDSAIVLLPVGSTEQHGPHLPVGTDNLLATYMSELFAAELCKRGKKCVVAPSIAVANSVHHMNFCGSLTLSPDTYIRVLTDYCRSIAAHGFRKIVIINGHGGNNAPTNTALVTINEELGFPVYFAGYWKGDEGIQHDVLESQTGINHACESETSLVLSYDASLVDPIYKETHGNPGYDFPSLDNGILSTFHRMDSHTENGVMGNSYLATQEKGDKIIAAFVQGMADVLSDDFLWNRRV